MALRNRIHTLESLRRAREAEEFEKHSEEDLQFFAVHGCYPEAIRELSGPIKTQFTTRGMRTTIILEPLK